MTSTPSLRGQTQADARAWMEAHRHELRGMPAEISGISTTGRLDHELTGDGWDDLWFRIQPARTERSLRTAPDRATYERRLRDRDLRAQRAQAAATPTGRLTRGIATDRGRLSFRDHEPQTSDTYALGAPRAQRGRVYADQTFPEALQQQARREHCILTWGDEEQATTWGARRSALAQMERGGLTETTILMGDRLPRDMAYDRHRGYLRTDRGQTISISDVYSSSDEDGALTPEEMIADPSTEPEVMGYFPQDVVEWCQQRLTARQWECLIAEDQSGPSVSQTRSQARRIIHREMPAGMRIRR